MTDAKLITAQHGSPCLSTCEEDVEPGQEVYWLKGVGVWHKECPTPRNLRAEQRTRQQRVSLGLEPAEFGKAPMLSE